MDINVKSYALQNSTTPTKAMATVTFGGVFKVKNISIMEGKNGNLFVSMPSYKTKEVDEAGKAVYKDICNPVTKDFREALYTAILESYKTGKEVTLVGLEQPDIRASEIHGTDRPIRLTAEAGVFPTEEELAALDVPFDKAVEDSASSKPRKDEKTKPSSIKDKLAKGESKKTEATKAKAEITKESASKTKEAVIA